MDTTSFLKGCTDAASIVKIVNSVPQAVWLPLLLAGAALLTRWAVLVTRDDHAAGSGSSSSSGATGVSQQR